MDRKTFLIERAQLQYRMEEVRAANYYRPVSLSSRLLKGAIPFLFSMMKYDRTDLTAVGMRIVGPFLARRAWNFISKA